MKRRPPRLQAAAPTARAGGRVREGAGSVRAARRGAGNGDRGLGLAFGVGCWEQSELVEGRKQSCLLLGSCTECTQISSAGREAWEFPPRGLSVATGANPLGRATVPVASTPLLAPARARSASACAAMRAGGGSEGTAPSRDEPGNDREQLLCRERAGRSRGAMASLGLAAATRA